MSNDKHLKKAEKAVAQAKASLSRIDSGSIRSFKRLQHAIKGMDKGTNETEAARAVLADIWNLHLGLKRANEIKAARALHNLFEDEHHLEEIMEHAHQKHEQDEKEIKRRNEMPPTQRDRWRWEPAVCPWEPAVCPWEPVLCVENE